MTIKEFFEMNRMHGWANQFNADANVYLNDEESAEFFDLFNSMETKPDFQMGYFDGRYILCNLNATRNRVLCDVKADAMVADVYRMLTKYMFALKNDVRYMYI